MMPFVFAIAFVFLTAFVFVPPVGALAWQIGAVDVPRDRRRMHKRAIPRSGGLAIVGAFLIGCLLFCRIDAFLQNCLVGVTLVTAIGLLDDVMTLGAWSRLFVQTVAAWLGCGGGLGTHTVASVLWVVLLTNAHNFIDGIDGLLAGCGAIESGALAVMLLFTGHGTLALASAMLSAACLAFRCYNRHPARVFAGDCGSGSIGYLLGVLSLPLFYEMRWSAGWLSPLLLFAYPIADLFCAVLRRITRGKHPFSADRAHLHHRICAQGIGQVECGRLLHLIGGMLALAGVLLCTDEFLILASISCALSAALLAQIGLLLRRI